MNRQEANLEILNTIEELVLKYPDLRFNQILINIGVTTQKDIRDSEMGWVVDSYDTILFGEEPTTTLKRIKED